MNVSIADTKHRERNAERRAKGWKACEANRAENHERGREAWESAQDETFGTVTPRFSIALSNVVHQAINLGSNDPFISPRDKQEHLKDALKDLLRTLE